MYSLSTMKAVSSQEANFATTTTTTTTTIVTATFVVIKVTAITATIATELFTIEHDSTGAVENTNPY